MNQRTALSCRFSAVPLTALSLITTSGLASAGTPEPAGKSPIVEAAPVPWVKLTGDIRLRYEHVDEDGLRDANAGTLRSRLGLLSKEFYGFQVFGEYEGTLTADRDSYRAASAHGPADRAVIADPESHELNQLWISYTNWDTKIKVGRQEVGLDNMRIIGPVAWRQNNQTLDAVTITNNSVKDLTLTYGYFNRVNRIFGSEVEAPAQMDFTGDSHILNARYAGVPNATIGTYAYLLDLHNEAGDTNSNNTYGAYIDGAVPLDDALKLTYRGEYAYQTDAFDSPLDYGANYFHLIGGVAYKSTKFGVGYESLGSDDGMAFQTPLATLHAFNGFADKFLTIPAEGLADLYVYAGTKLPYDIAFSNSFHWYGEEAGSLEYGSEYDIVLSKALTERLNVIAKAAFYFADDFATDTNKFWVEMNYNF